MSKDVFGTKPYFDKINNERVQISKYGQKFFMCSFSVQLLYLVKEYEWLWCGADW
jgi:hypothetical protein